MDGVGREKAGWRVSQGGREVAEDDSVIRTNLEREGK